MRAQAGPVASGWTRPLTNAGWFFPGQCRAQLLEFVAAGWLLGVHLDRLAGHQSHLADPYRGGIMTRSDPYDAPDYLRTTRATGIELRDKPEGVIDRLMRP
jgi:hypothetical protein